MKYLLMICGGGEREPSPATIGIDEWVQEMDGRGVRLLGRPLDPPATAAMVRVRDGETFVSDGPFAESKEFVAGYDIVDCSDLDEAIEVGSRHPVAASGAVEVRPFLRDLEFLDGARRWAAEEPGDSYSLFMCVDGIPAADEVEAAIVSDGRAWAQRARERGVFVLGDALAHADTATTIRVHGDEVVLSDGPFVETKEFIGGLSILAGVDREQAIELAAAHPLASHHAVEVRRFMEF
jgi:hypothetical protein